MRQLRKLKIYHHYRMNGRIPNVGPLFTWVYRPRSRKLHSIGCLRLDSLLVSILYKTIGHTKHNSGKTQIKHKCVLNKLELLQNHLIPPSLTLPPQSTCSDSKITLCRTQELKTS